MLCNVFRVMIIGSMYFMQQYQNYDHIFDFHYDHRYEYFNFINLNYTNHLFMCITDNRLFVLLVNVVIANMREIGIINGCTI